VDPGLIVVGDGLVDGFDQFTQRFKAVKLQPQVCLEVVVKRLLVTVLPRAAFPAQGYPDTQLLQKAGIFSSGVLGSLVSVDG